jgi:hypothetical protein
VSCSSFATGFCVEEGAVAGVASFNGRPGVVLPADADYDSSLIPDSTVGLAGTRVSDKLADAVTLITAAQASAQQGINDAAQAQTDADQAILDASAAQGTADGKLSDAPNDGTLYARKSAGWVQPDSLDVTDVNFGDVATGLDQLDTSIGTLFTDVTNLTTVAFTRELTASFTTGASPTYLPLKDFPLALGQSYILNGWLHLTSGPASAPLSGAISFEGAACCLARRTSGGVVTVSGTPSTVGGTIAGLATQWVVSGTNARLQVRTSTGVVCRVEFRYTWSVLAVP